MNIHYFSRLISDTRKKLGETGTEFGKRFGVTHSAVSDWENGKSESGWEVIYFCLWENDLIKKEKLPERCYTNGDLDIDKIISWHNEKVNEIISKMKNPNTTIKRKL